MDLSSGQSSIIISEALLSSNCRCKLGEPIFVPKKWDLDIVLFVI
jgi:hypothetical protein